jgi:excinuclease ABC subunit B
LESKDIKIKYIHHNIDTMERMEIIRDLRLGVFDVLVGINLLREGLDIPEVSLVAILDADKEGLLRSETALIQTVGRAARNAEGTVILYADVMTRSIKNTIRETDRRRAVQVAYNKANGITPRTIIKPVRELIEIGVKSDTLGDMLTADPKKQKKLTKAERDKLIEALTAEMKAAAKALEFERAAYLRDKIAKLQGKQTLS